MSALTTNIALCFIKPHANLPAVERAVVNHLEENGIRIISQGVAFAEDIAKQSIIERHYGSIGKTATAQPATAMPITADGAAKFEAAFGESWAGAVADGRVLNAAEAMSQLFGGDEDATIAAWGASPKVQKLGPGFYAAVLASSSSDTGKKCYCVNAFFLSMRKKFTAPGKSVRWFVVQWAETELSWADFRGRVIGATNPANAATESLRSKLYRNWKEYGLAAQPDGSDNGVHASASPLEGLAERHIWLGAQIATDRFGRACLDAGVDAALIASWMQNPSIVVKGEQKPVFDVLEDHDTSFCVSYLSDYCRVHGASDAAAASAAGAAAAGAGAGSSKKSSAGRNLGLVIIKPHANNADVQALVTSKLRAAGVTVKASADVPLDATTVAQLFRDLAYFAGAGSKKAGAAAKAAATSASTVVPQLDLNEKALFRSAFAREYDEAVEAGMVVSAFDALERLNLLGAAGGAAVAADRLLAKANASTRQRFSPSLSIGHVHDPRVLACEDIYVLNYFYPALEQALTAKPCRVLHVEFDEARLGWQQLLNDVVGATDPLRARPGSLRAQIYAGWRSLGLEAAPDALNNAVSCSGSPVEAMLQRLVLFGGSVASDAFGSVALACGVPEQALQAWLSNSSVEFAAANAAAAAASAVPLLNDCRGWDSSRTIRAMAGQRVSSVLSETEKQYLEGKATPARTGNNNDASSPSPSGTGKALTRSAADLLGGVSVELVDPSPASGRARSIGGAGRRGVSPNAAAILTPRRRAAVHSRYGSPGDGSRALASGDGASTTAVAVVGAYGDLRHDSIDLAPPRPGGTALHSPRIKRNPAAADQFGTRSYQDKYGGDAARARKLEEFARRGLTDTDLTEEKLRELWGLLDVNGDGSLDRKEFASFYRVGIESFGRTPSEAEVNELFMKYDYNRNGRLSFEEFSLLMWHRVKF